MKLDPNKVVKVDIGAKNPEEGFLSCPVSYKLPFPDNSITLLSAAHIIEQIPRDKFIKFMDECWRVLKIDGQMRIAAYYGGSTPFWADPKNVNGCTMQTWSYFDPEGVNGLLYNKYKPRPWSLVSCYVQTQATMEVLLVKRALNKKYGN